MFGYRQNNACSEFDTRRLVFMFKTCTFKPYWTWNPIVVLQATGQMFSTVSRWTFEIKNISIFIGFWHFGWIIISAQTDLFYGQSAKYFWTCLEGILIWLWSHTDWVSNFSQAWLLYGGDAEWCMVHTRASENGLLKTSNWHTKDTIASDALYRNLPEKESSMNITRPAKANVVWPYGKVFSSWSKFVAVLKIFWHDLRSFTCLASHI